MHCPLTHQNHSMVNARVSDQVAVFVHQIPEVRQLLAVRARHRTVGKAQVSQLGDMTVVLIRNIKLNMARNIHTGANLGGGRPRVYTYRRHPNLPIYRIKFHLYIIVY